MKTKAIARTVTAPQDWQCNGCPRIIKGGERCVKLGSKKFCGECIRKELAK